MARKPDWEALGSLFAPPALGEAPEAPSAGENACVVYLGQSLPKWLARDLMQERAAIYQYEAGLTRGAAEAKALEGLEGLAKKSPARLGIAFAGPATLGWSCKPDQREHCQYRHKCLNKQ